MKISYKKLFNMLKERNISKTALKEAIDLSSATLAKLSKNEPISMNTLILICNYLNCQPGELIEIERVCDENILLAKLKEEKAIKLKGSGW